MANTTIQLDLIEDEGPVRAYLYAQDSGLVAPASAGYALTLSATEWLYTATVAEALVGVYRIIVHDGEGAVVAQGYIWIEADDGNTYVAVPDYATAKMQERSADWVDGGRLDTILDTINTNVTTVDTVVDSISSAVTVIDTIVDTINTQTQAATIRTVVGLASADLDTQLDAIKDKTDLLGTVKAQVRW